MSCPPLAFPFLSLSLLFFAGCGGGGGSEADDITDAFNSRNVNLYQEVPVIEFQGNALRNFNPKTSRFAELYDSDLDGQPDTPINKIESIANAANNLLDDEIAACVQKPSGLPGVPDKHKGYQNDAAWVDPSLWPDQMPPTADVAGTNGTQFLQLILPFPVDPSSIFDPASPSLDYLNPDYLTIESEDGDGSGNAVDHVFCTVLVNGLDVLGQGPNGTMDPYALDPQWSQLAGVNVNPGKGKSSIIFIAQPISGVTGDVPDQQPFNVWGAGKNEIHIRFKKAKSTNGKDVNVNSRWYVLVEGGTPSDIIVEGIEASGQVLDQNGDAILDPEGNYTLVNQDTNFIIHFSKPVIPETVAQSLVFNAVPFNGNMAPIATSLSINPPPPSQNPCADNGNYHDPIAPNVVLKTSLILPDLSPTTTTGVIPFRCYPMHQNNLCTYIINPVMDLPPSTDLGSPPFGDPGLAITRLRISVDVNLAENNLLTGRPSDVTAPPPPLVYSPSVNMGLTGFFGRLTEVNTANYSETFTVTGTGRYVNAPVAPMALYYTMGPKGLGVVDLDGNGFTTNDPDFSKVALVTSEQFYFRFGNAGMGLGNNYSFGFRATGGPPYVGLGINTPMPGVNEGSTGMDEIVRDSKGSAILYPDPNSGENFYNLTDVELGDFLDSIFFDYENPWTAKSWHLSAINLLAEGSWSNNMIGTPPTPNPPPLTVPIAMRPTAVIPDTYNLTEEGAFVILGKEVFTVNLSSLSLPPALHTGFIHLEPAESAGLPTDEIFPPNRSQWLGLMVPPSSYPYGTIKITTPVTPDYMNLGPVADSATIGFAWYYGSRQQIGNFLFVADKANNMVRVLNSNTMDLITNLTGLNSPDQCTVSTDLRRLYVSNSGDATVSVFDVNPKSSNFLYQIAKIDVEAQPKGICVQPDLDDVLVCNYSGNSISIINPSTNTVRKTVSSLLSKPWDIVAAPRQFTGLGFWTGVYHAYISNYGGHNVVIYESGPAGIGGIGYDDILDPVALEGENGQKFLPIIFPRGLCFDPGYNSSGFLAGGCFVAHSSGSHGVVSRIQFSAQQAPMGPIFLIPNAGSVGGTPGFGTRKFAITAQWGGPQNPLSGTAAADVALLDYNRQRWLDQNWMSDFWVTSLGDLGANPWTYLPINNKSPIRFVTGAVNPTALPDRLYISFQFSPVIDVIDPSVSTVVKTITGLPSGAKVLKTFFKY